MCNNCANSVMSTAVPAFNNNSGSVSTPRVPSATEIEMKSLEQATKDLGLLTDKLYTKLIPILRPPLAENPCTGERPSLTPLAEEIRNNADRIYKANKDISDILDRLDL